MKKLTLFIIIFTNIMLLGSCFGEMYGLHRYSFMHDGFKRFFNIYIPKSYNDDSKAVPLVLDMHGIYQNATKHQRYTGFDKIAESEEGGFIVVYPEGIIRPDDPDARSWSVVLDEASVWYKTSQIFSYGFVVDHFISETDDVGFIIRIVEEVSKYLNIDSSRVYLAGLSQGGSLALRCAYEHSDLFAAVFASSSGMLLDLDLFQTLDPPIPVMKINAYEDKLVKYNGLKFFGAKLFPSVNEATAKWAEINGCSMDEVKEDVLHKYSDDKLAEFDEDYRYNDICKTYTNCASGVRVTQCSIHGEHDLYNYPSKESTDGEIDVFNHSEDFVISELAWKFFKGEELVAEEKK